jgi:hypothetical protein
MLGTDTYATIAHVIERLRRQTVRDQIEIVVVAPSASAVEEAMAYREEFAAIRVVEHSLENLAQARAAGVRAASAEWVFIGETHSYPRPDMADCLIRHASSSWSVITPAVCNANPVNLWNWISFLIDYGIWADGRAAGDLRLFPAHNIACRRGPLLALGDRLAQALALGGDLQWAMLAAGHRAWFEPVARIDHLNVISFRDCMMECFACGVVVASERLQRWSFARRVLYLLASPLIPVVLGWRLMPDAWRTVRSQRLPLSTVFWIAMGLILRTGGELISYAGLPRARWKRLMYEYEVHKEAFAGPPFEVSGSPRECVAEGTS